MCIPNFSIYIKRSEEYHVHYTLPHHTDLISTDALSLRLSMVAVT